MQFGHPGSSTQLDEGKYVLLAVVLEQQTELNPTEIMTDTGAYADVVFGAILAAGISFQPKNRGYGELSSLTDRSESGLQPVEWRFTS